MTWAAARTVLGWIPWWVWIALAGLGVLGWTQHKAKAATAALQVARNDLATQVQQTRDIEALRRAETVLNQRVTYAQKQRETELQAARRALDALRADRDRLRDDAAAFAAGGADDSAATLRERAGTLGRLLGEALQDAGACAADAEQLAADVRALRAAWPVNPAASAAQ
jgi:hypothetical protein